MYLKQRKLIFIHSSEPYNTHVLDQGTLGKKIVDKAESSIQQLVHWYFLLL